MDIKLIGRKIAAARKGKDMSQAALAQLLFISPQAVGKWERGESIPDIITINRLAEILDVDLNYFSEHFPPADNEAFKTYTDNNSTEQPQRGPAEATSGTELQLLTNFSGSDLAMTDFAGVTAHKRNFNGSALRGADFSGADLTGSSFESCDMREANFDRTDLTDCSLTVADLAGASFSDTILVRTGFSKTGMDGTKFANTTLIDVKLTMADLRTTNFEHCIFTGVDFEYCDMRGLRLDNQAFTGVQFDKTALNEATFNGATLKNVSFRSSYTLTNKYYRAIKTINFDGAIMDKLTYAALKGLGAELSKVTLA